MADFIAAETFDGAREGYDFGTGESGTGYYKVAAKQAREQRAAKLQTDGSQSTDEASAAESTAWGSRNGEAFDIDSVPAMSAEDIKAAEDAESARVAKHVGLVRSLADAKVVASIFQEFDKDSDGRLNMSEYGAYLKSISYSKPWTEAQWAKECKLIGAAPDTGVDLSNMSTLYTKYRARKLRIDYANVFKLPGEEVRKVIDEERRKHGSMGSDAAGGIGAESQMLAASDMAQSKLTPEEYKMMQGMLGGSKAKGTKVLAKLEGATETLEDGAFDANQTLVLMACRNCVVTVNTTSVKVFVNSCENVKLALGGKVITHTLEVYKSKDCTFEIATKIWTAQMDLCHSCKLHFAERDQFQTVISAGCHNLDVQLGQDLSTSVHYPALAAAAVPGTEMNEERTQFKTHFKAGRLTTEQVIRLDNGFPSTVDEKAEFDRRQEFNMKKLAEESGFTIARKKGTVKLKPNAPCACGSGKKQKKCCGMEP